MQLYVEGLCHGNLSKEEAIGISNIFKMNFPVNPLPTELRHAERVICLPSGANLVRDVSVKNKSERNSVAEVILVRLVVFFTDVFRRYLFSVPDKLLFCLLQFWFFCSFIFNLSKILVWGQSN
ncbi:hypothetical protein V8G54_033488 [Vigna mungo]|uniref:Uncharacterized protein n=1 Tax=Vigna mungo TaxID=3915 RepID=A0AAQ3MP07_VIGMU